MHEESTSHQLYRKMCQVLPGGVNSPVRACKAMGQPPMVIDSAKGDLLKDVDGNTFIDYCCSWGAVIHGHAHPQILEAVKQRMEKGTTFGITSAIEEQMASKLISLIPSLEMVRFVNSGTEATMTAVRLARGVTGKHWVLKFNGHYHGHADFFLVKAGSGVTALSPNSSSAGIPPEVVAHVASLPFNDIATARAFLQTHEVACVILEPIAGNMGVVPATPAFMDMLREETQKQGALLIFDEVMTGFRVGPQGAQGIYTEVPDLTTFGKVIGGGFPVAALGGRKEIMEYLAPVGPVYQAGTLSGNPLAMEAGYQALSLLEDPNFFAELERKTRLITEPVQNYIDQHNYNGCIQQAGSMFTLFFGRASVANQEEAKTLDLDKFAAFFRHMYRNGVYIPPLQHEAWFLTMAHSDAHLTKTLDLILDFLKEG